MSAAQEPAAYRGACLCRAVRYEVRGPWKQIFNCDCVRCRKHHGSLFATHLVAEPANFLWLSGAESVTDFRQSASDLLRAFCKHCGSTVPALSRDAARVPLGALEPVLNVEPQLAMCKAVDTRPAHTPGTTAGSCLCGDVAFEIAGELDRAVNCHCSRCRRSRGAAYGTNLYAHADRLTWTKGAEQVRTLKFDEARFFTAGFCVRCGSLLPAIWGSMQTYFVPAGCLDTELKIPPGVNIYTDDALPWTQLSRSVPSFPQMLPLERFSEFFFSLPKR